MNIARIVPALAGILWIAAAQAAPDAMAGAADPCAQIRSAIAARTGLPEKPDIALLKDIGLHPECRFTSAETYRAAYGDKPVPKYEERRERRHRRHNDDDDD